MSFAVSVCVFSHLFQLDISLLRVNNIHLFLSTSPPPYMEIALADHWSQICIIDILFSAFRVVSKRLTTKKKIKKLKKIACKQCAVKQVFSIKTSKGNHWNIGFSQTSNTCSCHYLQRQHHHCHRFWPPDSILAMRLWSVVFKSCLPLRKCEGSWGLENCGNALPHFGYNYLYGIIGK